MRNRERMSVKERRNTRLKPTATIINSYDPLAMGVILFRPPGGTTVHSANFILLKNYDNFTMIINIKNKWNIKYEASSLKDQFCSIDVICLKLYRSHHYRLSKLEWDERTRERENTSTEVCTWEEQKQTVVSRLLYFMFYVIVPSLKSVLNFNELRS